MKENGGFSSTLSSLLPLALFSGYSCCEIRNNFSITTLSRLAKLPVTHQEQVHRAFCQTGCGSMHVLKAHGPIGLSRSQLLHVCALAQPLFPPLPSPPPPPRKFAEANHPVLVRVRASPVAGVPNPVAGVPPQWLPVFLASCSGLRVRCACTMVGFQQRRESRIRVILRRVAILHSTTTQKTQDLRRARGQT